jgi:Tfp pilus assembly protein FimT
LKKFMLLAALLAMLALAAVPVIAQVTQEEEQETESGELNQDFSVTGSGDNSNQCVGIQGVGNTGNTQNLTDILQYGSTADEFEFEEVGSNIDVSPTNSTECTSAVNQAASASGK